MRCSSGRTRSFGSRPQDRHAERYDNRQRDHERADEYVVRTCRNRRRPEDDGAQSSHKPTSAVAQGTHARCGATDRPRATSTAPAPRSLHVSAGLRSPIVAGPTIIHAPSVTIPGCIQRECSSGGQNSGDRPFGVLRMWSHHSNGRFLRLGQFSKALERRLLMMAAGSVGV